MVAFCVYASVDREHQTPAKPGERRNNMSYEIMEIVALKAAGWALVLDEGEPRFSTDCYGNKSFLYAFAHSATGQVMRVKVRHADRELATSSLTNFLSILSSMSLSFFYFRQITWLFHLFFGQKTLATLCPLRYLFFRCQLRRRLLLSPLILQCGRLI